MPNWEEIRRILIRGAAYNGSPDPEDAAQTVITRLLESNLEPPTQSIEMYFYSAGRNEARNQLRRAKARREVSLTKQSRGISYDAILSHPLSDVERITNFKNQLGRFIEILSSAKVQHHGSRYNPKSATIEDLVSVIKYVNSDDKTLNTNRGRARRSRIRLRRAWELASQGDSVAGPASP